MWRDPNVVRGDHSARYRFSESSGAVAVVQTFEENDHHSESAVAIRFGDGMRKIERVDERTRSLVVPAKRGKRLVFVASAGSLGGEADKEGDSVGADAFDLLQAVEKRSYVDLRDEHQVWWHAFWARTFVRLSSDDGAALAAQNRRSLHLYYMASSSRGKLPPKWNGSLFATAGDTRQWGSQFWVWTTANAHSRRTGIAR